MQRAAEGNKEKRVGKDIVGRWQKWVKGQSRADGKMKQRTE